jgi:hypothetical protein
VLPLTKLVPSGVRARIKRELLRRWTYDASVRIGPEHLDLAPGETRHDLEWIRVQPDVDLKVYWKILAIGKGPAVSLYAFQFQILRFDCFGARDGHYHLLLGWPSPTTEERIWLPEPNATAQVERTMFELTKNITYYLQRHNDNRVRGLQLEPEAWSAACTRVRDRMLHFLCTVPELADVR